MRLFCYAMMLGDNRGEEYIVETIQGEQSGKSSRGEIAIKLGEETFDCKLNFDSLVRIETSLGTPILQLATKVSEANLVLREISIYILFVQLKVVVKISQKKK